MADIRSASHTIVTHIGKGVATEEDAIESVRLVEGDLSVVIEDAELRGEHIWVLATETGEVVGALDSRGGLAICARSGDGPSS